MTKNTFEQEILACKSNTELTEYLTLLKADMMDGAEALDLKPKTMVKKRENLEV